MEEVAEATGHVRVDDSYWALQLFEAPKNVTASSVTLYLEKEGEVNTPLRIEFYKVKEPTEEEMPIVEDLDEKLLTLIKEAQLLTGADYDPLMLTKPDWYEIRIPTGVNLRRGTIYGIMVKAPAALREATGCTTRPTRFTKTAGHTRRKTKERTGGERTSTFFSRLRRAQMYLL